MSNTVDGLTNFTGAANAGDLLPILPNGETVLHGTGASAYVERAQVRINEGATGEVSRKLVEALRERTAVSIKDWGVVGDDGETDNSDALANLRAHLIAVDPRRRWTIHVPAGRYAATNNRWLHGLYNIQITGDGESSSSLRSSFDDSIGYLVDENRMAFRMISVFNNVDYATVETGPYSSSALDEGYLIDTATSGTKTIIFQTGADAANFSIGNRVFLYGYSQQGTTNWPPNIREKQWGVVDSVDTEEGSIGLFKPLVMDFRSDWPEEEPQSGFVLGPARVINLDDGRFYPNYFGLSDIEIPLNDVSPFGQILQIVAQRAHLQRVRCIPYISPRFCEYFLAEDCQFWSPRGSETDKGLGTVIYRRCDLTRGASGTHGVSGAHTAEVLIVDNCQISGSVAVSPKRLTIRDSTISNDKTDSTYSIGRYSQSFPSRGSIEIIRNRIIGTNAAAFVYDNLSTLKAGTVTGVGAANEMKFGKTDRTIYQQWDIGLYLANQAGTKLGRITAIYEDATDYIVEHTVKQTIEVGDIFHLAPYNNVTYRDNEYIGPEVQREVRQWTQLSNGPGAAVARVDFGRSMSLKDALWTGWVDTNLQGVVEKVIVHVTEAYSGSDTTALFAMQRLGGPGTRWIGRVNLLVAGRRVIEPSGITGTQSGDDFDVSAEDAETTLGTYFHQWRCRPERESSGYGFTGTTADMPSGYVEVYIDRRW